MGVAAAGLARYIQGDMVSMIRNRVNLPLGCNPACQAPTEPGADMIPEIVSMKNQKNCVGARSDGGRNAGAEHMQKHAVERHPAGQCEQEKRGAGASCQ